MTDLTLQVGDTGTKLLATIVEEDDSGTLQPVDISSATGLEITIAREAENDEDTPTAPVTRSASLETDGLDGKLFILTEAGDIDAKGSWLIQGAATIGAWSGSSAVGRFRVAANIA